jgi:HK97 family phage major capsid protein
MKACELRAEHAKLIDEQRELAEKVGKEKRPFTAEEQKRSDEIFSRTTELSKSISSIERFEAGERATEADYRRISEPLPHEVANGKHKYSVSRAILKVAGREKLDGLEGETSQEIAKRVGKNPQGFFVPQRMPMSFNEDPTRLANGDRVRGIHAKQVEHRIDDTTAGTGAVLTRWDTTWIEYLRALMVLNQLGPKVLTDMHGNFALPRQSGIGTLSWVAESAAVSTTAQTIDQVLFTPKTAGAFTDMSRRFLEQLSIDAEQFVREDLAAILARGIETAVYAGTGSPQPQGILGTAGVGNIGSGTNGDAPTWTLICQMEEALAKANVPLNANIGMVMTPQARATLKLTPKQMSGQTSYFPVALWGDDNTVNGYPAYATNLMPSNLTKGTGTSLSSMILANWSEAILAFWSGMDVLVDPYTGGPAGTIRIVVLQDLDFEVRHAASFCINNDLITQ